MGLPRWGVTPLFIALAFAQGCNPTTFPRFAYVTNGSDGTLSIYSVDATTGALTARGYVLTGLVPRTVVLTPSGRFLYVADETSNDITAFAVDTTRGFLSPVVGSPFPAGTGPYAIAVHPAERFAYVANDGSDNVSGFAINPTTGALTPISGSPFAAGHVPRAVVVHPSGSLALVLNQNVASSGPNNTLGSVSVYRVNPATGALTPIPGSPLEVGVSPFSMVLDPSGRFLYVANTGVNLASTINAFAVNTTSGALSPLAGSPYPAGLDAQALTMTPSGAFLYAANGAPNTVSTFAVATSGALSAVPGSAPTGNAPDALAVDPTGAFLYATNFVSNDVSVFTIHATTGALSPTSTMRARSAPTGIAVSHGTSAVTPTPRFLYGASASGLLGFSVNATTGAITSLGPPITPSTSYDAITTDLAGQVCFAAANQANGVAVLTINQATGALTPVAGSPFAAGASPSAVVVDPSGRFVYVTNSSSNNLSAFTVNPSTRALTPIPGSPYPTGPSPYTVSIDPTGRFIYEASYVTGAITAHFIDPQTGALSPVVGSPFFGPTITAPPSPKQWGSTIDPSGRYLYLTSSTTVFAYDINGRSGVLTPISGSPFATGSEALGVVTTPSGRFAYVGAFDHAASSYAAFGYSIGPGGGLTPLAGSPFASSGTFDIAYGGVVDAQGRFLYLATDFDTTIVAYALDPATGAASPLPGSPFATQTNLVALTATASVQ